MFTRRALLPLLAAIPAGAAWPLRAEQNPADLLTGGRWELRGGFGEPVLKGQDGKALWLRFDPPRFSGFAGCNRVMGTFEAGARRFRFDRLSMTKMLCAEHQETERRFIAALEHVREWSLRSGELALIGRARVLLFVRSNATD